ncbi:unnamed protein product [Sympodiomycopsis kandeliae]
MVSAAELQRLHEQQNQQHAANGNGNAHANLDVGSAATAPMADPFPALTEDPFPAAPLASGIPSDDHTAFAAKQKQQQPQPQQPQRNRNQSQPDFSSQSAFPSLGSTAAAPKGQWGKKPNVAPGSSASAGAGAAPGGWAGGAPVIQRAVFQETFSVPYSESNNAKVGAAMTSITKKYKNAIKVEASTTRSTSTTNFVVKGSNEAAVKAARKELTVALAKRVTFEVSIPQSLRAFVIGAKGKNLKHITETTGCQVNIPRQEESASADAPTAGGRDEVDYDNDEQIAVSISGDEINARQAAKMVQDLVAERTSRTTQRLTNIEHIFYPFISGPKGANIARLENQVGNGDVSVRVPPRAAFLQPKDAEEEDRQEPRRERDLAIIVTGDRDQVQRVAQTIEAQVEEIKRTFRNLTIQVPKRQHRFLVGDAANDILAETQCSVELAPQDDPSDAVTIRGPQTQLPVALSAVMEKANAVQVEVVDLVAAHRGSQDAVQHAKNILRWLNLSQKIPRKQGVQVFTPRPALIESTGNVQIEIVGAQQADVVEVRGALDALIKSTPPSFTDTIEIDPLLHALLIGKKGANLKEYEKRGVDVAFPPQSSADGDGRSDIFLIVTPIASASFPADKKARETAAKQLLEEVKGDLLKASQQAADLKTEVLQVQAKHHRAILGTGGSTLNAVIGEDRLVAVKLGNSKGQTGADDTITVRGPSNEVDRVVTELKKIAKYAEEDAIVNGHEASFSVDPAHVKHLVGKSGASITKLREELGVRIDFDDAAATAANGSSSAAKKAKVVCKITGRKENVEEAKKRLTAQAEKLADEREEVLKVPQNLHSAIIGKGGVWVTRLQDNHGVRIDFPRQGSGEASEARREQKPDEVIVRGGKKGVAAAKSEILELLEYEKENNNTGEISVNTQSLARILGKAGATINQIRDDTGASIDIDNEGSNEVTKITLRGTKQAISGAKQAISAIDAEVKGEESFTLHIPSKYHGQLIGPGGQGIRDLVAKATGSSSADPRASTQLVQFPRRGEQNADVVIVRGPSALAKKVKEQLEAAAKVFTDRVCHGVAVSPDQQRLLIGRGGSRRSELEGQFKVRMIFPGRSEHAQEDIVNANEVGNAPNDHIIKILGKEEDVDAIKKEILSNAQSTRVVQVPRLLHQKLAQPNFFRHLRSSFGVSVDTPRVNNDLSKPSGSTVVRSSGSTAGVSSSTARIDDAEDVDLGEGALDDENGGLAFELIQLDSSAGSSGQSVDWTLSAEGDSDKANASLTKASDYITKAISEASSITHEGRLIVPESAVPRIVGKKGAGLQSIETDIPGVSVEIPRDATPRGLCIIRGTESSVLEARDRLVKIANSPSRRSEY